MTPCKVKVHRTEVCCLATLTHIMVWNKYIGYQFGSRYWSRYVGNRRSSSVRCVLTMFFSAGSGFLTRVGNTDLLTRKKSLPPFTSLSHPHPPPSRLSSEPVFPFINAETQQLLKPAEDDENSENQDKPLTPGGSFSPGVTELLQSFKLTHRRAGSNGSSQSFKSHRRQGSNGSARSFRNGMTERRGDSLTGTPLKAVSRSSSTCSAQRNPNHKSSTEHTPVHGLSTSSIPYSRVDMSDSDNEEHSTGTHSSTLDLQTTTERIPILNSQGSEFVATTCDQSQRSSRGMYSNESSADTPGSDGHETGSESNDGDCESAGEDEDPLGRLSESNEESPQSPLDIPRPPDGPISFSSSSTMTQFQFQYLMPSSAKIRTNTDPFQVSPTHNNVTPPMISDGTMPQIERRMTPTGELLSAGTSGSSTLTSSVGAVTTKEEKTHGQVAMLISQFESPPISTDLPSPPSPQPVIPVHIRRESHDVETFRSSSVMENSQRTG